MDRRDEKTWVVLELSALGEQKVKEGILEPILRRDLELEADFPIFIPIHTYEKQGKQIQLDGLQGYVFVQSGLPDYIYFSLENKDYIKSVMSIQSGRYKTITTIPDTSVQQIRDRIRQEVCTDLSVGMEVKVILGDYTALIGSIIGFYEDKAHIEVRLRSIHAILSLPKICIDPIGE